MNAEPQVTAARVSTKRPPAGEVIDISIVIPVYNESDSLRPFRHMLSTALESITQSVEIIFCDDGSEDGSATLLDEFAASDPRICVVHCRNPAKLGCGDCPDGRGRPERSGGHPRPDGQAG